MFSQELIKGATDLLEACRSKHIKIATAESCTGGLIAGLLTEIPGASDVLERGFVTYSNEAKKELLEVSGDVLQQFGAVSEETARAMAQGALKHSDANITIAVTGIAGPGGGSTEKPVGLVHIAGQDVYGSTIHEACKFGDIGRRQVRLATVKKALQMLHKLI